MTTRRDFLGAAVKGAAITAAGPLIAGATVISAYASSTDADQGTKTNEQKSTSNRYQLPFNAGLGGVAIGNGFKPTPDAQAEETLEAAWKAGIRYYDTSPWYGLGLSERRFGHFLHTRKRDEYILSTKVGRLLKASAKPTTGMWKEASPFRHEYDYTAAGVRRSVEDSLQRLGIESIDIVYIHDLSPDNGDMGDRWTDYFEIARKGAMPELTRMREEGIIKGWGLGVNTIEPILKTLEVADADVFLSATQYSLMYHQDALNKLFPACEKHDASIVVGAPLNAGFLAGVDRYDYRGKIPEGFMEKRAKMNAIAHKHGTDLRTAALQFSGAPKVVAAVIPGARNIRQVTENAASAHAKIPKAFWDELKQEKLIAEQAPIPA